MPQLTQATSLWARMKGLLRHASLREDDALWITPCSAIHTCGMRFPIDAIFLDRHGQVVRIVRNIPPWRLSVWGGWRAHSVIETAANHPNHAPFITLAQKYLKK